MIMCFYGPYFNIDLFTLDLSPEKHIPDVPVHLPKNSLSLLISSTMGLYPFYTESTHMYVYMLDLRQ